MTTATRPENAQDTEWEQLEAQSDVTRDTSESTFVWRHWNGGTDTGVNYKNKPHPKSYGARLPMRSELDKIKRELTRGNTSSDRGGHRTTQAQPRVSLNKAHPDSYRPDLPLRGLGLVQMGWGKRSTHPWTVTPEEAEYLSKRPLMIRLAPTITPEAKAKLTKVARKLSLNFATIL